MISTLQLFSYFVDHVYKIKPKTWKQKILFNVMLQKETYVNTCVQQWNTTLPHNILSEIRRCFPPNFYAVVYARRLILAQNC